MANVEVESPGVFWKERYPYELKILQKLLTVVERNHPEKPTFNLIPGTIFPGTKYEEKIYKIHTSTKEISNFVDTITSSKKYKAIDEAGKGNNLEEFMINSDDWDRENQQKLLQFFWLNRSQVTASQSTKLKAEANLLNPASEEYQIKSAQVETLVVENLGANLRVNHLKMCNGSVFEHDIYNLLVGLVRDQLKTS